VGPTVHGKSNQKKKKGVKGKGEFKRKNNNKESVHAQ
jgi:hypothetical protein